MKKLIIYASVIGLTAGIIYWLYKKEKSSTITSKTADMKVDFEPDSQREETQENTSAVEEMYQAKNESSQSIYERHSEAGSIMKDVYSNIMENFVETFSDGKNAEEKGEKKEDIIDGESVSLMKEIDSISDELDDLLK